MASITEKLLYSSGNILHYGLNNIYTVEKELNRDNLPELIQYFYVKFLENRKQIIELKKIMVGNQAILNRPTDEKTSVNEKVNINIIFPIVNTMAGIFLGEKVDYIYNGDDTQKISDTIDLVKHLRYNGDILLDKNSLVEMLVSGLAYQYSGGKEDKKSPILLANIVSENCFSVRSKSVGNPIKLTCIVGEEIVEKPYKQSREYQITKIKLTCFTDTEKITLVQGGKNYKDWEIVEAESGFHQMPKNPIQEIQLNSYLYSLVAQLEAAQNAFNVAVSDSINSIIQQIRALLVIIGAEITKEDAENANITGVLNATSATGQQITASFLTKPLDEGIVNLRQFLFDIIVFISGLPKTDGGTSGNAGAAFAASGLLQANQNAYFNELEFQKPKQALIDNVIAALKANEPPLIKSDLSSFDIEIRFDRNKLTDIVSSATALATLLGINGMPIKPALKAVGLFSEIDKVAAEMETKIKEAVVSGLTKAIIGDNIGGNANATTETR